MTEKMSVADYKKVLHAGGKKKVTEETAEKKAVRDYFNARGFFYYHNLAGMGVYPGIADYTVIKKGFVFQIEVKKQVGGVQSENQKIFEQKWCGNGGNYICGNSEQIINYLENFNFEIGLSN